MIQFQFFPRSIGITSEIRAIIDCFTSANGQIDSSVNKLPSNGILHILNESLSKPGFKVEISKSKEDKIAVPVLFGTNNKIDKCMYDV